MAENKKYLDLSGLGYAIRKMDGKKADIESPAFTGTPTINNEKILVNNSTDDSTSIVNANENLSLFSGKQIDLESNGNIVLRTHQAGIVTYNGTEIATTETVSDLLDEELDTRLDEVLTDKIGDAIEETIGDRLDEKADIDSPIFTGTPTTPAPEEGDKSLQIANTKWVDDNYIGKVGDATVNGSLLVKGEKYPLLTLQSTKSTSSGYLMNIQGNLMFGDCTSNNASRQYYGRMVPALGKAVVGAVAIGYNPKDEKIYKTTKDYGIKIDVDIAPTTSQTPTIERQVGSFFVGVNGAYVGYSENINQALNYDTQVYRVLDSKSIKTDEYIVSLEQRIAALEAKLEALTPAEDPEAQS